MKMTRLLDLLQQEEYSKKKDLVDQAKKEMQNLSPDRCANAFESAKISIDPLFLKHLIENYIQLLKDVQLVKSQRDPDKLIPDEISQIKIKTFFNKVLMSACNEILDEKGNLHPVIAQAFACKSSKDKVNFIKGMASQVMMLITRSEEHSKFIQNFHDPFLLSGVTHTINQQKSDIKNLEQIIKKYTQLSSRIKKDHPWFAKSILDDHFYISKEAKDYLHTMLGSKLVNLLQLDRSEEMKKLVHELSNELLKNLKNKKPINIEKINKQLIELTSRAGSRNRFFDEENKKKIGEIAYYIQDFVKHALPSTLQKKPKLSR